MRNFKPYSGERTGKATRESLQWPHYLNMFEHCRKIRDRKQGKDIGKYSFVNSVNRTRTNFL